MNIEETAKIAAEAMRQEWIERGGALDFDAMALEAIKALLKQGYRIKKESRSDPI